MNVTEDHRFWSVTDADWVELQDLDTSDVLLSPDGATVTVDWLDRDAGVTTDDSSGGARCAVGSCWSADEQSGRAEVRGSQ